MKTYTVYRFADGAIQAKSGCLKVPEAFAKMMALAGTEYVFRRYSGTMRLDLIRTRPVQDMPFLYRDLDLCRATFPLFESSLPDDESARADLMEQALRHGRDGVVAEVERILSAIPA
jgi:hypothetical protein